MTESSTAAEREDAEPARLGSILDRRRWRIGLVLGGVGDSVGSLLPLFVLTVLSADVAQAAVAASAYTLGSLVGNVFVWGRLADRVRSPRGIVIWGTGAQGLLLVLLALLPSALPIMVYAAVVGLFAVSMDPAVMRLVAGDLEPRERLRAAVQTSTLVERGILLGLLFSTVALPLLTEVLNAEEALRLAVGAIGVAILAEGLIALSTVGHRRAAPRFTETTTELAAAGFVTIWSGATTPVRRVLRVTPLITTAASSGASTAREEPLPESLVLMLVSLMVLHAGFGMQGNLLAAYLREEAGLADGAVVGVLLLGAVLTNVAVTRVGEWLDRIPAVQVQVTAGAVRTVVFGLYAALAVFADETWSLVLLVGLYMLSQLSWGSIVPANTRRFASLAPASRRGEVAGLQSAFVGIGVVAGVAVGGVVAETVGFPAMFGLSALLALVGTVLLLRW